MKSQQRALFSLLVLVLSSQWLCVESQAIPPFARKYGTSCQTCHVIMPKLNSFGEAFRLNGYKIPEAEAALVKEEPVVMGAPAWKQMFPNAMWPSDLPGLPPVGIRLISHMEWTSDVTTGRRLNFEFPHEFEFLVGGRFDEHFGFFSELEFKQNGPAEIVQAFLVVNDFMSWAGVPEYALSARVGIMDQQLLFSHNNPTRAARVHPLWGNRTLNDWRLLEGATVRRSDNTFRLQNNQPAIELNGILARRLYWGAGVASGNGPNRFDVNTEKDFYYKLKYKPFGRDFLGTFAPGEEVTTATKPTGSWVDNGLLLEHFGYFGFWPATTVADGTTSGTVHRPTDDFWYLGSAARWTWQDLDLAGGYVHGHHSRPWGTTSSESTDIRTWFVKAEYMFFPWLMGRVAYEEMDADEPGAPFAPVGPANFSAVGYNGSLDVRRILAGPIFSLRANVKVALEAEVYLDHEGAELVNKPKPNIYWVRLDFAM